MSYRMGWTISFEGKAFCEGDLTLADTVRALDIAGGDWTELHPLRGPGQFIGLLTAFLVSIGEDPEAAAKRVAQIRYVDALEMVKPGEG